MVRNEFSIDEILILMNWLDADKHLVFWQNTKTYVFFIFYKPDFEIPGDCACWLQLFADK